MHDIRTSIDAPVRPVSRCGDLWRLADHRLLCGDSTEPADMARLMAGETAGLCFTSPPYARQRRYAAGEIDDWDSLMQGAFAALPMAADGQILVNLGIVHRQGEWWPYWNPWLDWMKRQGWRRFGLYVWDQGPGLPGDWGGRLAPSFELLFHFNRGPRRRPNKIVPCKGAGRVRLKGKASLRQADGTIDTWSHNGKPTQDYRIPDGVIRVGRQKARNIRLDHPAVFPVALAAFVLEAYAAPGDRCLEPFAGSGTCIVAGQRTGRRIRAMELAPAYVDEALRRWCVTFPGEEPRLDGDGRGWAEIAADRTVDRDPSRAGRAPI